MDSGHGVLGKHFKQTERALKPNEVEVTSGQSDLMILPKRSDRTSIHRCTLMMFTKEQKGRVITQLSCPSTVETYIVILPKVVHVPLT
jgi:hypothetical protein